jgi:hypothetical protein
MEAGAAGGGNKTKHNKNDESISAAKRKNQIPCK